MNESQVGGWAPRRVLVTGGAGFIGAYLVRRLLAEGVQVDVLDDLSSPVGPEMAAVETLDGVTLHVGSVRDGERVGALVSRVDAVFHLAAVVGVRRVLEDPVMTLRVDTLGTDTVLVAAAEAGKRVVFASSSEVYGTSEGEPLRETRHLSLGPPDISRWCYANSKLYGEFLGFALARARGLRFVAARLFSVAGPGQRAAQGMVLPSFVQSALRGEPLRVHGDGLQERSFLYAGDAARLLWQLVRIESQAPIVVNVASNESVRIVDVASRVIGEAGGRGTIVHVAPEAELPEGFEDVRRRNPDTSRLRALIGPLETTPLSTIIRELVARAVVGR